MSCLHECKGVVVLFEDSAELIELTLVYDTHYDVTLGIVVCAETLHTCGTVMQSFYYLTVYLVCVCGDYSKLICVVQTAYHTVADKAGDKAIKHTHTYGLVVIDKLACKDVYVCVDEI